MDIKKFWQQSVTFDEYLKNAEERLQKPKNQQDVDFKDYYKLGLQRMHRMLEKYCPDEQQLQELRRKNFKGKILVICEAWCGDGSQALPVVEKFFKDYEVRVSYRDQEPSLIDSFLSNGGKSIPVIIFLDEDFKVLNHWGPRPAYGISLLNKHKNDPEAYPKDDFYRDLQAYYAKNKGYDTIEELLTLI
ncbi:thioredoxin family protein [Elizabethkingia argentiflava]|uniref:Thioredoxin family protein n=1 Tax=Elizabethkingia argenteiflava TaxID=2681556 RepID=A0A845PVS4_9FLAO|nr:thioredoxin family protein [Elizabethkingia argenteiflava]NAW50408.1 thioredoxin family protein [Elizabethkingia argenteiflava]